MKLLTKEIEEKLRANARNPQCGGEGWDPKPVVKFFNPTGSGTWLITELHDDGAMYGLCDVGQGEVERGYVSLAELAEFRDRRFGLGIERDLWFAPKMTISQYEEVAQRERRIVA
jgi:hypothetical protein